MGYLECFKLSQLHSVRPSASDHDENERLMNDDVRLAGPPFHLGGSVGTCAAASGSSGWWPGVRWARGGSMRHATNPVALATCQPTFS